MTFLKKAGLLALIATGLSACGGAVVYSRRPYPPPPPAGYRVMGVAPGPGYVWIDGYHDWRGRGYYWVPGRWTRPPRPHATWVPGYWQSRGGGHIWIRGRWRY
jgi:hypothetical protein